MDASGAREGDGLDEEGLARLLAQQVLDRMEAATDELAVVAALADAVGSRRTTVERLRAMLTDRPRMRRRGWVERVERAHGLPVADRQVVRRGARGREYRDVQYAAALVVELDGRLGHDSLAGTGRDADRDLDDHADGRTPVRLRWRQVFGTPCRTAYQLSRILRRPGWDGSPRPCGPDCRIGEE